ncbi:hypothetical protein [Cryobacterium arcticum]|uniref:Uncharacterized protein n=1 Tax=Cryobacterium arcticum TaxID=670052 RepID=A0A1B1BHU9_9MICO|nr:hypothetical protein [Cryobacterium arcticum]ANP72073.1 hypothetical protein PA27867_1107 [Cryobacterium arcticum]
MNTTTRSTAAPTRPRWYAPAIGAAVLCIAALSAAALVVDDDATDSVLGFFTGALAMLLVALVAWTEVVRHIVARKRDAAALDDLEPLRAATESDRGDER